MQICVYISFNGLCVCICFCADFYKLRIFPFASFPSFTILHSLFLSPFRSFSLFPPLPVATANRFGERLSPSSRSGRRPATKRYLLHFGLKNASGKNNFCTVRETIASAHKTRCFYRENWKTEAVSMGAWHPLDFPNFPIGARAPMNPQSRRMCIWLIVCIISVINIWKKNIRDVNVK